MGTANALVIPTVLVLQITSPTPGVATAEFSVQAVELGQERALASEELRALRETVGREAPAGVAFRRCGEVKTTAARLLDVHLGERRWNVTFGRLSDETVPEAQRSEARGVLRFWKAVLELVPACKDGAVFSGDPAFLEGP